MVQELQHVLGEGHSWVWLMRLAGGGEIHGKRRQIVSVDRNELGDGSFGSSVHGEEESRSPEVLRSPVWESGGWGLTAMAKSPISGLPTVEKRPQIPLNHARWLVKGSIKNSWAGEEVSRSPEVTRGLHHTPGRGRLWKSGVV